MLEFTYRSLRLSCLNRTVCGMLEGSKHTYFNKFVTRQKKRYFILVFIAKPSVFKECYEPSCSAYFVFATLLGLEKKTVEGDKWASTARLYISNTDNIKNNWHTLPTNSDFTVCLFDALFICFSIYCHVILLANY